MQGFLSFRFGRSAFLLPLLLCALFQTQPESASADTTPYPRLANAYLAGWVDPARIPTLAKWDLLILNSIWTNDQLRELRRLNPSIKIFFYVCPYCVGNPPNQNKEWEVANWEYAQANDLWWRNADQSIASDWPGSAMVNITAAGPRGPSGTWREFIASRVEELMSTHPDLDGVFYDNFWKQISWEQGSNIQVDSDCNPTHNPAGCDGVMDSAADLDTLWNRALRNLAQDTRERFDRLAQLPGGRPLAVIGNGATDYYPWLNGSFQEFFPFGGRPDPGNPFGYGWNKEVLGVPDGYLVAPFRTVPYNAQVLNSDWTGSAVAPDRTQEFERHKRFTLVSALLGDGYYSLDAGRQGHGAVWWEPEYDQGGQGKGYLGHPIGPMYRVGVPSGPELVTNGSFTSEISPWRFQGEGVSANERLDTAVRRSPPSALRIDVQTMPPQGNLKIYQTVPVTEGKSYLLRLWARSSVPQQMWLHLYSENCPRYRCLNDTDFELTNDWTLFEFPFVSAGSAEAGLNIFLDTVGTVWLDDVSLQEGDTAVYRRDFELGVVLLNYTSVSQKVFLGGGHTRLDIPGSPVFDGAAVEEETIPAWDARILLGARRAVPPPPQDLGTLHQNEPNPFNPSTVIRFDLTRSEKVHLAIYDMAGRLVRTLVKRPLDGPRTYNVRWEGIDRFGRSMRSGVYFYRIVTPSFTDSRKMLLLM